MVMLKRNREREGSRSITRRSHSVTAPAGSAAHLSSDEEGEELRAYDLLVGSLQPLKRARMERQPDLRDGGGAVGRELEEVAVDSGEDESASESDGGESRVSAGRDPFSVHIECDLTDEEVGSLKEALSQPLHYQHTAHPVLGSVGHAVCLPERDIGTAIEIKSLAEHHVKQRLISLWCTSQTSTDTQASTTTRGTLSYLQQHLFAMMNSYKDMVFTRRTFENAEDIRKTYVLHALNHVLKTRSRVLKNNARLACAAREDREMEEPRDQGLTRPKVLILVPFREAALRTINTIISLLLPNGEGQVSHRRRFQEEFGGPQSDHPKVPKPASFLAMFAGNIDDCFRLGVAVRRNAVKLYSEFYSSDLIVASPLGLRTIIGADGEKHRDFDFLSSLEVVIVDQTDVFLMQNWDHLTHVFDHLHQQPHEPHGVDFSRVRHWVLNGWSKFYRQTLLFGAIPAAEVNSLLNKYCFNFAGRLRVSEPSYPGSVCQVVKQVPQTFHHISCPSHTDLPEARFSYFIEQVLPEYSGELTRQTLVFIPSYFDFVRVRNHMKRERISFAQICEYTKISDISRARTKFFHGQRQFLLYTERTHFYRRFHLRGVHHIVFYSLPLYPDCYSDLVNCLEADGGGVTILYSRYDVLQLNRVVGSLRAARMLASQDNTHLLVTAGQ